MKACIHFLSLNLTLLAGCLPSQTVPLEQVGLLPDDLTGTEWELVAMDPVGSLTASAATAAFTNGELRGSTGCNSYSTTYQVDNGALILGSIVVTEMACLESGVMEQEAAFLAALGTVSTYELHEDRLVIAFAGGTLRFAPPELQPPAALEGASWVLEILERQEGEVMSGQPVPEGMEVSLTFQGGQLSGSTGCNDFGAPYQLEGERLSVGTLIKTEALCPTDAQILFESQVFEGLESAGEFALSADRLSIHHPGGRLIFHLQDENPGPVSSEMVVPPAAVLTVAGQSQSAGIGTYCWSAPQGEVTMHTCADAAGIATPQEPLAIASSPFSAHLSLPLSEDPTHLTAMTIPVTDSDAQDSTARGYRWWDHPEELDEPDLLPLLNAQELTFDLPPGSYVVQISAWWDGIGDVVYGFLLEVQLSPAMD